MGKDDESDPTFRKELLCRPAPIEDDPDPLNSLKHWLLRGDPGIPQGRVSLVGLVPYYLGWHEDPTRIEPYLGAGTTLHLRDDAPRPANHSHIVPLTPTRFYPFYEDIRGTPEEVLHALILYMPLFCPKGIERILSKNELVIAELLKSLLLRHAFMLDDSLGSSYAYHVSMGVLQGKDSKQMLRTDLPPGKQIDLLHRGNPIQTPISSDTLRYIAKKKPDDIVRALDTVIHAIRRGYAKHTFRTEDMKPVLARLLSSEHAGLIRILAEQSKSLKKETWFWSTLASCREEISMKQDFPQRGVSIDATYKQVLDRALHTWSNTANWKPYLRGGRTSG